MKRMLENLTGNYSASASVVDGNLIISLPDAISPVVWRLDLGQAKASALEVKQGPDGNYTLQLKTQRGGAASDIASFTARGRAVTALMAVSRAMEQAHGQIYPAANDSEPYNPSLLPVPAKKRRKPAKSKGGLGALAALAMIVILGGILLSMGPKQVRLPSDIAPASGTAAKDTSGIPISADEFLKNAPPQETSTPQQ